MPDRSPTTLAPSIRLGQYDPKTMPAPALPAAGPTALLVCHGMGQQVPFETLECIAAAIVEGHAKGHADISARLVQLASDGSSVARVEIALHGAGGAPVRHIHLYEAYWAPLTEKAISFRRTAWFLVKAGALGLRSCVKRSFARWMFGGWQQLALKGYTALLLFALLAVLPPLLLVASASAFAWPAALAIAIDPAERPWLYGLVLLPFVLAMLAFRRFVVQYMGDVAIYVSSNEVNEFWQIRDQIKGIGLRAASAVYQAIDGLEADGASTFVYGQVVVVGHSLGSVVAYDTLNAIFGRDQPAPHALRAVERTYAFITLGSPLDKTAFLFRQHVPGPNVVREVLAAAVQPMIQSYDFRPRWWINVHAKADIISGSLDYYDDPAAPTDPRRVRNLRDPVWAVLPSTAHTGYWGREPARMVLYQAVTGTL